MEWDRYKLLCDSPDVCSRWLLEQTLEVVEDASLASRLKAALAAAPLEKPEDHRGGPETDMFPMALTVDEVRQVWAAVAVASAAGRTTSGTRGRGLGGFVEAWGEYLQFLERGQCSPAS